MEKKITLYTGKEGYNLFLNSLTFCASDNRLYESDLAFIVNEEDIEYLALENDGETQLFDVIFLDSISWIK